MSALESVLAQIDILKKSVGTQSQEAYSKGYDEGYENGVRDTLDRVAAQLEWAAPPTAVPAKQQ